MGVLAPFFSSNSRAARRADDADGPDAFLSEEEVHRAADVVRPQTKETGSVVRWPREATVVALVVAVIAVAGVAIYSARPLLFASTGLLRVESNPANATITVDGAVHGVTPAMLELPAGRHQVTLNSGNRTRTLAVDITANATTVHHVELPVVEQAPVATTGGLQVTTAAPATVTVDGTPRGVTPLVVTDLTPGEHQVVVSSQGTTYRRTIQVDANRTVSLVFGEAGNVAAGWMVARTAIPLTITEGDRVIGTTESDRIMLPAGDHTFEFSNEELGFTTTRTVSIDAGRVSTVTVPLPQAALQINALPWAEVWIDGERVGETPIANVMQTIGRHEIVFRHPQLGERRMTTIVKAGAPARATVDMRTR